jgi:hypothetical protein
MSQTNFTQICSICGKEIDFLDPISFCNSCIIWILCERFKDDLFERIEEEDPNGPKTTD